MPIDPSALPWWGWLICGVVGIVIALVSGLLASDADITEKKSDWAFWWFVGMVAGLGGAVAFAIGIIRFVKWAWS